MSNTLVSAVCNLPRVSPTIIFKPVTRAVLKELAFIAQDDGTGIFPSVATLQRRTDFTRRAIQKALADLRAAGFVTSVERPGKSSLHSLCITLLKTKLRSVSGAHPLRTEDAGTCAPDAHPLRTRDAHTYPDRSSDRSLTRNPRGGLKPVDETVEALRRKLAR